MPRPPMPVRATKYSRRDFIRLGAAAGTAVASGAFAGSHSAPAFGAGAPGGILIFGEGTGPDALDPLGPNGSTPRFGYYMQLFDTLAFYQNGKINPALATSWKILDPLTWEFQLRSGVTFHNGEAFDANAVKFSIDRILDPNQKSTQRARFTEVSGAEVVSPYTVRIHTRTPFPVLLIGLTQAFIVPPKYTTANPEYAAQHPVGTGPFKFADWRVGNYVRYTANKSYWRGAPKLDGMEFRVIPDDATRLAALKAGEVHIDMNLPLDAIDAVARDPNLRALSAFIGEAQIIEFETLNGGPTANQMVRQAMNYAVNKEEIIKTLLDGKEKPLQGQLITPGILGFNPNVHEYPYDPGKAKELLAQAGYPNGFDTVVNGPIGKYTADREIVNAVAAQLQQVGIRAKANPMEYSLFAQKLTANQLGPMFLIGWYSFGDPALAEIWLTSKSTLGHYYNDATYDKLVFGASEALDPKERQRLYNQAAQYMHDQALALFLFQPATYYGVSKKVSGFTPRDDELPYFYPVSLNS